MKPYNYPNPFECTFDDHIGDATDRRICAGMANTLWAGAWADHEEQVEGRHYVGQEYLEIADTPAEDQIEVIVAWVLDARAKTCEENHTESLADLYARGCAADHENDMELDSPEAFGSDLGMQIQGSGVSWFDDHADFPLELPYKEFGWQYLDWPECDLKLTWGELRALKALLSVARHVQDGTIKAPGPVAVGDPPKLIPLHRIESLIAKVEEHFSDGPADDDGAAEDA